MRASRRALVKFNVIHTANSLITNTIAKLSFYLFCIVRLSLSLSHTHNVLFIFSYARCCCCFFSLHLFGPRIIACNIRPNNNISNKHFLYIVIKCALFLWCFCLCVDAHLRPMPISSGFISFFFSVGLRTFHFLIFFSIWNLVRFFSPICYCYIITIFFPTGDNSPQAKLTESVLFGFLLFVPFIIIMHVYSLIKRKCFIRSNRK